MKKLLVLFMSFFIFSVFLYAEDLTIADVAAAQQGYQDSVQTFAASVSSETEFGGIKKTLDYDYVMQTNENGDSKVMITGTGALQMQFLVDTAAGSVTYLMANGTTKTFTLTPEEKDAIMSQYAGLGSFGGSSLNTMFADKDGNKSSDAKHPRDLRVKEAETADYKVRVKKEFFGNKAVVEYENKKMALMKEGFDRNIMIAEETPAKNGKDKKIKKKYLQKLRDEKENVKRHMIAKRVEKINLDSGITEEQEFYNEAGEKLGFVTVKRRHKIKVMPRYKAAGAAAVKEREIEMPAESEVEMSSPQGKAKTNIVMNNIKVNEDVKFEWVKTKQEGKK